MVRLRITLLVEQVIDLDDGHSFSLIHSNNDQTGGSNNDSYFVIHKLIEGNDDDDHSYSLIHRPVDSDDNYDQTDGKWW